jgi:phage baseplate assembly protein V
MGARDNPDEEGRLGALVRVGTVASVDLAAGRCTVDVGDVVTAPVRWLATRAGATRAWSPVSVGEQGLLLSPGGDIAGAVFLPGIFSSASPPPGDSLAELVEYQDGARIGYDPQTHALTAILPAGATARLEADGGVSIKGDITLTGKLTASGDVVAGGISLMNHKHGGVQAGGAKTGAPE